MGGILGLRHSASVLLGQVQRHSPVHVGPRQPTRPLQLWLWSLWGPPGTGRSRHGLWGTRRSSTWGHPTRSARSPSRAAQARTRSRALVPQLRPTCPHGCVACLVPPLQAASVNRGARCALNSVPRSPEQAWLQTHGRSPPPAAGTRVCGCAVENTLSQEVNGNFPRNLDATASSRHRRPAASTRLGHATAAAPA